MLSAFTANLAPALRSHVVGLLRNGLGVEASRLCKSLVILTTQMDGLGKHVVSWCVGGGGSLRVPASWPT